jgi:MYXO-CTERM domain-containing protein
MIKLNRVAAIAALGLVAGLAQAQVVFQDSFNGNSNANLALQTFASGATTDFAFWPIGTPGDMSEGYFSVVNRSRDVHSQFTLTLDADNNPDGSYAAYNGFQNVSGSAYSIHLVGLTPGQTYSLSAMLLTLAADPPYPDQTFVRFMQNGSGLGSDITLVPVPSGSEAWAGYSREFVATGDDTLAIGTIGSGSLSGNDFGLDNVAVTVVPAPGAAALIGVGMLTSSRRRRV